MVVAPTEQAWLPWRPTARMHHFLRPLGARPAPLGPLRPPPQLPHRSSRLHRYSSDTLSSSPQIRSDSEAEGDKRRNRPPYTPAPAVATILAPTYPSATLAPRPKRPPTSTDSGRPPSSPTPSPSASPSPGPTSPAIPDCDSSPGAAPAPSPTSAPIRAEEHGFPCLGRGHL